MKIKTYFITVILCTLYFGCGDDEIQNCGTCGLEPKPGPCNASFTKYYFDNESKKCKKFIWGGCEGVVPFNSLEECELCGCN